MLDNKKNEKEIKMKIKGEKGTFTRQNWKLNEGLMHLSKE